MSENNFHTLMVNNTSGYWTPVDINVYSDNTPIIKLPKNVCLHDIDIYARPVFMSDLVATLAFAEFLKSKYGIKNLFLPYVPGARQDRDMGAGGDVLFMAKYVAEMINKVGFKGVFILDPHSSVTPALINNCKPFYSDGYYCLPPVDRYEGVIAPDGGAEKRAAAVAKYLGIPLYHAWKTRNTQTGAIDGVGCEDLPSGRGGQLLVVDDICDGGKTFVELGKYLLRTNYGLTLFVTHGIFSKGVKELLSVYDNIITTDSIITTQRFVKNKNVTVLDCFSKTKICCQFPSILPTPT
jgi:ribose-phosphate pyrophosphokinase